MDKHEYIMKNNEIRICLEQKRYEEALDILETMDIGKVKVITDLSVYAEVFLQNQMYEDCKDILLRIRERTNGRRVIYQLIRLAVCMKEIDEAEYYYGEYIKVAPKDSERFILRYRIDKMKGEPVDVLIKSLERLKEHDYIEVWAYELAKLYHKAGMEEKCISECNDIILWFGDGDIVEKAKILKEMHVGKIEKIEGIKAETKQEVEQQEEFLKAEDLSHKSEQVNRVLLRELELTRQKKEQQEEELKKELEEDKIESDAVETDEEIEIPKEIQSIFKPFMQIEGMVEQISKSITNSVIRGMACNYILLGEDRLGKIEVTKMMAQALWKMNVIKSPQIAKISATSFNRIDISLKYEKLRNTCLLVEAAGCLSEEGVKSLLQLDDLLREEVVLFLEDTKENMDQLLKRQPELKSIMDETVEMKEEQVDYLFYQAVTYFQNYEYEVNEDTVKKLKETITSIVDGGETEGKIRLFYGMLDRVLKHAEARTMQQLFEVVTNSKYLNSDLNTILVDDFIE